MVDVPGKKTPAVGKKIGLGGMKPPAPPAGAPGVENDKEQPDTVSSDYFFRKGGGSVDFDDRNGGESEEEKAQ